MYMNGFECHNNAWSCMMFVIDENSVMMPMIKVDAIGITVYMYNQCLCCNPHTGVFYRQVNVMCSITSLQCSTYDSVVCSVHMRSLRML